VGELAQLPPWRLTGPKNRAKLAHYRASLGMLRRVGGDLSLVGLLSDELDEVSLGQPAVGGSPRL